MDQEAKDCTVCLESFNNKQRRMTTCPSCHYKVCGVCIKTYFTTSRTSPQCMNCHKPWTHQFLRESLGGTCLKQVYESQKTKLFDEQKLLIPYTQEFVQFDNACKKIDDAVNQRYEQIKRLKKEIADIEHERHVVCRDMRYIAHNFQEYMANGLSRNGGSSSNSRRALTSEPKYIQPCGKNNCKGFIKTNGVCGLCNVQYCKECMNEKADDHVCKESDVLTIQMLKKDTKPCPKCSNPIHRISGCPDMFCVSCCTAFNWNTLKIDERGNSNPLYYAWIRDGTTLSNNTEFQDECREIHVSQALTSTNIKKINNQKVIDAITSAIYSIHHRTQNIWEFKQNTSGRGSGSVFRYNAPTTFESHTLLLRARYMQNEISETNFKTQLMRIHKALEYNETLEQIKNTISGYRQEMMREIIYSKSFNYVKFLTDYVKFVKYINECVDHMRNVFYDKQKQDRKLVFITIPRMVSMIVPCSAS